MKEQVVIEKATIRALNGDYIAAALLSRIMFFQANQAKFSNLFQEGFLVRTRDEWATDLLISTRQVSYAISKLESAGLLQVVELKGKGKASRVNGFKFIGERVKIQTEEEMPVEAPNSLVVTSTPKPTVVHHYDPKPTTERMPEVSKHTPMVERKVAAPIVNNRPTKRLDELFPERKELVKPNNDPYTKEWKEWKGRVNWFVQTPWWREKINEVSKSFNVVTNW